MDRPKQTPTDVANPRKTSAKKFCNAATEIKATNANTLLWKNPSPDFSWGGA
ncbi:hypothetical protein GCM10009621_10190 [Corynebacterium felinum]